MSTRGAPYSQRSGSGYSPLIAWTALLASVKFCSTCWFVDLPKYICPDAIKTGNTLRKSPLEPVLVIVVLHTSLKSVSFDPEPAFGIRLWLNKPNGRFVEGDQLLIHVEVDHDAYLKLDYFQANGTVVHLVPNLFRGQAFVQKGKTYVFGGEDSPERFIISEPFGNEVIKAVASVLPFLEELTPKGNVSESQAYLKTLKRGLSVQPGFRGRTRGVKITSGVAVPSGVSGASASLSTSSQEVSEFKKSLNK